MRITPHFKTLSDLKGFFPDEKACRNYLFRLRWNNTVSCPHCGNPKFYRFKNGLLFKCAACRKQFSVKVGTQLEDSKVPLRKWFVTVFRIISSREGISSVQLSKELRITQKTAWLMLDKIRQNFNEAPVRKSQESIRSGHQPMIQQVRKSFEEVIKTLLTKGTHKIQHVPKQVTIKKDPGVREIYQRPLQNFDPETD